MPTRLEIITEAKKRGLKIAPQDEAIYRQAVKRGLVQPADMDPATRLQQEQAADQRTLADILQREGGGLKETFPPTAPAESLMGDVAGEVIQKAGFQNPQAPTGGQALAQGGLGLAGGAVGQALGGRWGSVAGSAAGTFLGGLLTGRGGAASLHDAAMQLAADAPLAAGAQGMKEHYAPSIKPSSKAALQRAGMDDLLMEGPAGGTPFSRGRETQRHLEKNYSEAYSRANDMYREVRKAAPAVEITHIREAAENAGLNLKSELGTGQTLSFDAAQELKHTLQQQASGLRRRGDAMEARHYTEVAGALNGELNRAAEAGGVGDLYRHADQFYATEIAGKFHGDTQDIIRFSGSRIVDELTPSSEVAHQRILSGTVDEARAVVTGLRGMKDQPDALPTFREGIVSTILERATDRDGVLNPAKLQNLISPTHGTPEVLNTYLGKDVADSLRDFAANYGKAKVRISNAPMVAGMAATAAGAGAVGGPGAAIGAGVEVANELGRIGSMIVRNPTVMNQIKAAVLRGDELMLRDLWAGARLVTGQAAGGGLRQIFAQPSGPNEPIRD